MANTEHADPPSPAAAAPEFHVPPPPVVEELPSQEQYAMGSEELTPSKDGHDASEDDSPSRWSKVRGLVRESSRNLISRMLTFE